MTHENTQVSQREVLIDRFVADPTYLPARDEVGIIFDFDGDYWYHPKLDRYREERSHEIWN